MKSARPVWPAIKASFFFAAIALVVLGFQGLLDDRYWWHLAVGDLIVGYQRIPDVQLFLFSVPVDTPWIYGDWLGSVILAEVHALGGAGLNQLVRNLFGAAATGVVVFAARRRSAQLLPCLAAAAAALVGVAWFAPAGPTALLLPLLALTLVAALSLIETSHRWWPALLFPLTTLVAINISPAASLALMVVGLAVASQLVVKARQQESSRGLIISAILLASSAVGVVGFAYGPTNLISVVSTASSLTLGEAVGVLVLAVVTIATLYRVDDDHLPAPRRAMAAIVVVLALFVALLPDAAVVLFLLAGLALIAPTAHLAPASGPRRFRRASILAFVALLAAGVALQPGLPSRATLLEPLRDDLRERPPGQALFPNQLPLRCAEELARTGRDLRIFHTLDHAGFLLFHTQRSVPTGAVLFDDHRGLTDPERVEIVDQFRTRQGAQGLFEIWGINAAVIPHDEFPALLDELQQSPRWQELFPEADSGTSCFLRT